MAINAKRPMTTAPNKREPMPRMNARTRGYPRPA